MVCSMKVRIAFAIVGIIVGLSVTVVFAVEYHNINASAWGFISGWAAAMTLYIHLCYKKKWYGDEPFPFRAYMYCGCFTQLMGICGFVVYIVLAVYENQGVQAYGTGYYLASVWCFMTLKWGFQLFYFSRLYWRHLTAQDTAYLLPEDKALQITNYDAK